jgi:choline/ethanolamine kinase
VYLSRLEGCAPTTQEKQQLLEEIALFSLASHMFWGIWGIVNINQDIEFGYWVSFT